MGKVDRTEDEIFNEHLQNFSKQQNSANKLQKEFNNYIRCVRGKLTQFKGEKNAYRCNFFGFIKSFFFQSMTLIFSIRSNYYYKILLLLWCTQIIPIAFYIRFFCYPCDLAVQVASKSLMDTLNEMYESQWVGHDHMCTDSNNLDMLWSDYTHKLADQVLIPLNTYQAQFAETRVSYYQYG